MLLRWILCIILYLAALQSIPGQDPQCPWAIHGAVIDEHDEASLGYATIYITELDAGIVTDSIGGFRIEHMCAGQYTLRVSHIGCETREYLITVDGNEELILHLEHHAEVLQTVELHGTRVREAESADLSQLDKQTLLRASGQPIGEILEQLPGVGALQTGPAIFKPVIHGLHSNRIIILRDGLRLESQQWGLDHAPEIDPNSAQEITVAKGSAAVQYGADAVGGVILIESPELPSTRLLRGTASLTAVDNGRMLAGSASVSKGLGKGVGLEIHGGYRRAGDFRAADYLLTNTGVAEGNFRADLGYSKGLRKLRVSYELFHSGIGILRSAHIGNLTDLLEALERDRPLIVEDFSYEINNPKQVVTHHTAQIRGSIYSDGLGVLFGQYAIQWNNRQEYDLRRGGRDDTPALDLTLQSHTGLLSLTHEAIGPLRGKVGLHWSYRQNENIPGTGVKPLIPNYTQYNPAISVVEKWTAGNLNLEGGFRYEYNWFRVKYFDNQSILRKPEFQFNNFSASAGLQWDAGEYFSVHSHLGYTRRAPQVHELFSNGLHHGAAAIEYGDTSLVPEQSLKWVSGAKWTKGRVSIDATVHYHLIPDFIYLNPTGEAQLTIRGAFPVFQYVQDDARLVGGEATISVDLWQGLQWTSEYAMLRAWNKSLDDHLFGMPSDRMRHSIKWRSENKRADIGISYLFVWKQTRVPEDSDFAPPPDSYGLAQFDAGYAIIPDNLNISLSIKNLLNVSYREYLNRLRYYADDLGRSIEFRINYSF